MSYILDALKRADAERGRGAVPGLHARQLPHSGDAAPTDSPHRGWWLVAGAVALATAATGLWLWRTPGPQVSVAMPLPVTLAPLATPAPLPVATPPTVAPAPPAPRPATPPAPSANANAVVKPGAAAQASVPPPSAQQSASVAPALLPLLSELPEALRRQIPALAITGTVYSDDPKQRLLLVNNLVVPQGSTVAAELSLDEIKPHSSVFTFRGTRFRLAH